MLKKLSKIICIILLICLSAGAFIACDTYKWGPYAENPSLSGNVEGENGGMAVKKGGYLYFINGYEDPSSNLRSNEFGKVIKGSICRMPIADLNKTEEQGRNDKVEIIVPKVIVANYTDGGFYIFGDWIYYTTPNSERGSGGGTQTSWVDFMKVKVDGSGTTRLMKIDPADNGGTIPFKFYLASDNKVYLIYQDQEVLYKLNATDNGKASKISEEVIGCIFGKNEVYYTCHVVYENADGDEVTEEFNTAWSYNITGEPVEISATLAGMTGEYADAAKIDKYTFALLSFQADTLFYTKSRKVGGIETDTKLWGYKADEASKTKPFTGSAANSNFLAISWADGLVVYTGSKFVRYPGNASATEYTPAPYDMYFPVDTGITLYFLNGNNLYYGVGGKIWRFDITLATATEPMLKSKAECLTLSTINNAWFKPKMINNKLFFINNGGFTNEDGDILDEYIELGYTGYTYFVDLTNIPSSDVDDDDLGAEVAKEVFIGKHDDKDYNEDDHKNHSH